MRALAFASLVLAACASTPPAQCPPAATVLPVASSAPSSVGAPPAASTPTPGPSQREAAALSVDQLVQEAAAAREPVLLDFGASWCKPCALLAQTFARPEIAPTLARFRMQAYDIDDGAAGSAADDRFEVRAHGVPLLVVLGWDGVEIDRLLGVIDPDYVKSWLDARARVGAGGPLTDERLATEKDSLALLLGARAAARAGQTERARHLFEATQSADPKNEQGNAAQASFELLRLRARDDTLRDHGALLVDFATKYPRSQLAADALRGLTALPSAARPASATLQRAVAAVRKASPEQARQLGPIEFALGLSKTPPPAPNLPAGVNTEPPEDPLAEHPEPAKGGDAKMEAIMRARSAIGVKIGKTCKDAPRPPGVNQESVRVWSEGGAVKRALLLDPEADPALKACLEHEFGALHDIPGANVVDSLWVIFPASPGTVGHY